MLNNPLPALKIIVALGEKSEVENEYSSYRSLFI